MKEWRECRIAWIGGEEGEQHGWYYASVGRTYLGLLEQCNPGLSDIRRSITLPDGATIHVGRITGNRFIKIDLRDVRQEIDSLYMESGFIAIGNPNSISATVADTGGTYLPIASTAQLESLKSERVLQFTEPDGGIQGAPKSYSLPIDRTTQLPSESQLPALVAKNNTSAYTGPSKYSGRMRLFVQSKLGKKLISQTLQTIDGALWWEGRPLGWSAGFTTGLLYDETLKTYFLIDWFPSGAIYASRLILGPTAKVLRNLWEQEPDATTKRVIEAYILSQTRIDVSYSAVQIAQLDPVEGDSLYYGPRFNANGSQAALVTHTFGYTEQKHRAWRYEYNFAVSRNTVSGALEWSVTMDKREDIQWYSNQVNIWFPTELEMVTAQPLLTNGVMAAADVPVMAFYDEMDELTVVRYHLSAYGPSGGQIGSGTVTTGVTTCHNPLVCGGASFSDAGGHYTGIVTSATVEVGNVSLGGSAGASRTYAEVTLTHGSDQETGVQNIALGLEGCGGAPIISGIGSGVDVLYGAIKGGIGHGERRDYSQFSEGSRLAIVIPFDNSETVFVGSYYTNSRAWTTSGSTNSLQTIAFQAYDRFGSGTPEDPAIYIPATGWQPVVPQSWQVPGSPPGFILCDEVPDLPGNGADAQVNTEFRLVHKRGSESIFSASANALTYEQAESPSGAVMLYFIPTLDQRLVSGERPAVVESLNGEMRARLKSTLDDLFTNGYPETGARAVSIGWQ